MHAESQERVADDERMETIRMLRESAAAFLGADLGRIRRLRFQERGFDRAVWREMCALGWPGVRLPEASGGLGFGMREYCAVSRAKARASRCASLVCREAIQLHGAIGYTDEADIGLFLRKAMTLVNLFGSERAHRERYLALTKAAPARRNERAA